MLRRRHRLHLRTKQTLTMEEASPHETQPIWICSVPLEKAQARFFPLRCKPLLPQPGGEPPSSMPRWEIFL